MRTPNNESVTPDISNKAKGRSDSGPVAPCAKEKGAERRCILTGDNAPRDRLLRLAIAPADADGVCAVLPDPQAKAPGRGAWIGVDRDHLEDALEKGQLKGALSRAFKNGKLAIPDDLPQRIEDGLRRALLQRLGLELRAGQVVLGTMRIAEQARSGRISLLLHANDASEDGRKKLDQAWRVGQDREGSGERGTVLPLDREALSVALGRENVVHLALAGNKTAERVGHLVERLLNFQAAEKSEAEQGAQSQQTRPDDELNI